MFKFDFNLDWLVSLLILLVKSGLILIVGHFIIKFIIKLINKSFNKTNFDLSLEKFVLKAVKISLYLIVVLSALNALGISTTGLLAALSAGAVGIALALKDSLSSIAAGILLLVSPRFATGDFIEINGESGTVMQIDLIHTTLKTIDNRHVVIPNSTIINSQLVDYSSEEKRRVDIVFPISYESNAKLAEQLILETVKEHPLSLDEPEAPFARVSEYAPSLVNITTRVWSKAADYWQLRYDLLEQVRSKFDQNGITIPYNQLDVHISNK